jgi:hypothetical protein
MNRDTFNFIRWINKNSPDKKYTSWFSYFYDEENDYSVILDNVFNYEREKNIKIDSFDENGIVVKKNNDEKIIYFDVDGTFYDLYNYPNWLECILSENIECYTQSTLLVDENTFIETLNNLKNKGYKLGIITWLSKNATKKYQNKVRNAKYRYLKKHFSNLFDEVHILQYGTNKSKYCKGKNTILFDDEKNNRIQWNEKKGISYDVTNIVDILKTL